MSDDLSRYHRQMLLPGFGEEGQRRLLGSTVLILGCGALGSMTADLFARAGVGHLVIVDRDFIEMTNLQRQVLFDEQDVADFIPKAEAARRRIARINSGIRVTAIVDDLNFRNIERYAEGVDVLVDGLDNFETRYLANDLAVKHGIPYIYGGAVGTVGAAYAILPHTAADDAPWGSWKPLAIFVASVGAIFGSATAVGMIDPFELVAILHTHETEVNVTNTDSWHWHLREKILITAISMIMAAGNLMTSWPSAWRLRAVGGGA